ncbi:MAG: hypothetical protein PHS49_05945 [Candidatus Gracilibacteria bacterium]|nr:hypothetical protein [Candidatus Gracilibacteria bacterium]
MLEYILHFYTNYTILFYILVVIIAIIEGPIIILALSLVAGKLGFSYFLLYSISFLGDFIGDMIHYGVGRFFSKRYENKQEFKILLEVNKKLEGHSLFDKLIVIKYTPPITSIGLIYLGYKEKNIWKFMKNDAGIVIFNALFITAIGYHFGNMFVNNDDFTYFMMLFFFSLALFYIGLKFITKYLIKKIYDDKNT